MTDAALQRMTPEAFLHWRQDQEGTWELVDGVPALKFDNGPEMMAGGRRNHAYVAASLLFALKTRLRGGPSKPVAGDLAVQMPRGNVRQPDVTVECGRGAGGDLEALEPKVLFEVLSPSTRRFDLILKTNEYQQVEGLAHFVMLEPDRPEAVVSSRGDGDRWLATRVAGPDAVLDLSGLGLKLPLAELYEDVELSPG